MSVKLRLVRGIMGLKSEKKRCKALGELLVSIYEQLDPVGAKDVTMPTTGRRMEVYHYFLSLADDFAGKRVADQMYRSGTEVGGRYLDMFGTIRRFGNLQRVFQLGDLILGTHPVNYTLRKGEINEDKHTCLLNDAVNAHPTELTCDALCTPFVTGVLHGMGYDDCSIDYFRKPAEGVYCNRSLFSDGFDHLRN